MDAAKQKPPDDGGSLYRRFFFQDNSKSRRPMWAWPPRGRRRGTGGAARVGWKCGLRVGASVREP